MDREIIDFYCYNDSYSVEIFDLKIKIKYRGQKI